MRLLSRNLRCSVDLPRYLLWVALLLPDPGLHAEPLESAAVRFEYANDFYFGTDSKLSGAWSVQKHSAATGAWDELASSGNVLARAARWLPTCDCAGSYHRTGLSLAQAIQTPGQLTREELIPDDVPYAGTLTLQSSWYTYDDRVFSGLALITGVIGPASGAEHLQSWIHRAVGASEPKGWDNQLHNELLLNLNYLRMYKLLKSTPSAGTAYDISLTGNVALGNLATLADGGLMLRYGSNMPGGFVYLPDPTGNRMNYRAAIRPADPHRLSLYTTLTLHASVVARDIFLDGNTFVDSHSVSKKTFVGEVVAGLHYETERWAAHFSLSYSSDNVDTSRAHKAVGQTQVGVLTLEWLL